MDKMNSVVNAISGGLGTAKQHIREITNDLREMARQAGQFSASMAGVSVGAGGGGNLGVGQGGSLMTNPSFTGGPGGGQPVGTGFGGAGRFIGAAAFAGMQAALPGAGTAVTTDAALSYVSFFSGGNLSYGDARRRAGQLNAQGLPTSRTDATTAMLEAQRFGFVGQPNFSTTISQSFADVSRLMPGAGLTGGAQVMGTLNQARTVNMARAIGIQIRDPFTGQPKSFQEVGDQIYRLIENGLGRPPTEKDINSSLMPGGGLYNFMNDLFGNDELTKNSVIRYLLQKSKGRGISSADLRATGATTFAQQAIGAVQSRLGQITGGASGLLSGLVGIGSLGLSTLLTPIANIFGGGRKDGGPTEKGKAYIVGEKEPELFIPSESGTVVRMGQKGGPFDREGWAKSVLGGIGAPSSNTNVQAMLRWMAQEGGHSNNSAYFNPLNTTKVMPGELGVMNDHGVRRYANWEMGLQATLKTLNNGLYQNIIDAFRANADPKEIYAAIVSSKWGTKNLPASGASGAFSAGKYNPSANTKPGESVGVTDETSGAAPGFFASTANPFRGAAVNYGGVNITINGANVTARDLVEEIKKQLKYENILTTMGLS